MSSSSRISSRQPAAARSGGWFGRRKKNDDPLQERIDCLIGADVAIQGDVVFAGGLRIDGQIRGDVTVSDIKAGTLMIGDEGRIQGDVRVSHVIIYGHIEGTVYASGLVDLRQNARISGDVHYGALEMQAGAVIEGHLVPHRQNGGTQ
ncbi:cytoskeletal protein CcmA (bactofilin family) [Sphaerotilus hippei]|uniref:Cytoskeletal protein CcmA (Bactofilin family) n=1 Tax=Sphaerotilus hippei TaxID=744406 RepID=A0A318GWX2_9BURK|nr:polymer-forming cytoskeletal protein [Sphaerotilus hippei]PXW94158.1 cytoskeletal protein CcmA (bactofilin family) [Sphaerotilus hippei]